MGGPFFLPSPAGTCRARLATDATLERTRNMLAAAFGLAGLAVAALSLSADDTACEDAFGPLCSPDRAALSASGVMSWCAPRAATPPHAPQMLLAHFVSRAPSVFFIVAVGA